MRARRAGAFWQLVGGCCLRAARGAGGQFPARLLAREGGRWQTNVFRAPARSGSCLDAARTVFGNSLGLKIKLRQGERLCFFGLHPLPGVPNRALKRKTDASETPRSQPVRNTTRRATHPVSGRRPLRLLRLPTNCPTHRRHASEPHLAARRAESCPQRAPSTKPWARPPATAAPKTSSTSR